MLNAKVTPAALLSDSSAAVLSAVMVEALSAPTDRFPSTSKLLSVTAALTSPSTRLVAINPLIAAREVVTVALPAPAAAPGAAGAAAAVAPPAAGSAAAGSAAAGSGAASLAVTSPDKVASIDAACRASTSKSSPAVASTRSTSAKTSLRTSFRTTIPPTAAEPPPSLLRLTSATIDA